MGVLYLAFSRDVGFEARGSNNLSFRGNMTSWTLPKFARVLGTSVARIILIAGTAAQPQAPAAPPLATDRAAIAAASRAERDRELKLLGITEMQPAGDSL